MRVFQKPDGASCSTENGFICKQGNPVYVLHGVSFVKRAVDLEASQFRESENY